jgi:ribonuclease HIII
MSPTVVMSADEITALRTRLEQDGFEFRTLQYAHFQARGTGVVVSAYRSGKVVIQG